MATIEDATIKSALLAITSFFCFVANKFALVESCNPESVELHGCVNTYLEKDFPLLQTVFQQSRRHMLLDGPDLKDICEHGSKVAECQEGEYKKCRDATYRRHLGRAIAGLRGIEEVLCRNTTQGLREFLHVGSCIEDVRKTKLNCPGLGDFNWPLTTVRMMRLQEGPEACPKLLRHHECMIIVLEHYCDKTALPVYNRTITPWLRAWCFDPKPGYDDGAATVSSPLSVCVLTILFQILWLFKPTLYKFQIL